MRLYRYRGKTADDNGNISPFEASSIKELIEFVFRNLTHPGDWNVPAAIAGADILKRINWVCAGLVTALLDEENKDALLAQLLQTSGFTEFEVIALDKGTVCLYKRFTAPEDGELSLEHTSEGEQAQKDWTERQDEDAPSE